MSEEDLLWYIPEILVPKPTKPKLQRPQSMFQRKHDPYQQAERI
jgi:hypothetical protein